MKSPEKLRRSEFATSELPSELMVRPFDATLTAELPETMVNCSPSLSPMMVWLVVVVVCTNGRTVAIGATDTMALTSGMTRGLTLVMTSGVTTVCKDTTGSTETIGVTTARTRTSGATLGAAGGAALGEALGCGTFAGAATGAGVAGDCADCCAGSAGGSVVCGAVCCDASEWRVVIVGRDAATRHTTGIAQSM